jgi:hypothetical protein
MLREEVVSMRASYTEPTHQAQGFRQDGPAQHGPAQHGPAQHGPAQQELSILAPDEWRVGDLVEMPLYGGRRKIRGVIEYLDLMIAGKSYKGLVLLGIDSRYYEFVPEIAHRITRKQ